MMGQKPDAKLTPDIARDLCQRTESAAVLEGSLAMLGSQYVLGLRAVNCRTGDPLGEKQVRVTGKERVLSALDNAAASLRQELGESLRTVQKFDTPLEQVTTSSLEALQAYSMGRRANEAGKEAGIPFFQQAIRLDPKFAMAYASLGTSYSNLGETILAAENIRKAYELRDRVSEREKFYLDAHYNEMGAGNLEKALQSYQLWEQTYPRDQLPLHTMGSVYDGLGQYDHALEAARNAVRLDPTGGQNYANLVGSYLNLNRLEEAQAMGQEALKRNLDSIDLRWSLLQLAFAMNDAPGLAQQSAWLAGQPGGQAAAQAFGADTEAYCGRLTKARELSRQAVIGILAFELNESAAGVEAESALREALFGYTKEARQHAAAALRLSKGRDAQFAAMLALTLAGDTAQSDSLTRDLSQRFSQDTLVQFVYLPTLYAQADLNQKEASRSIEALRKSVPYELASPPFAFFSTALYPIYVRGSAFLTLHQGNEAAAEFQKILDHRGVVLNEPIGALAHLQLGRAYAMSGDKAKARDAYQSFLTLWKDADPGIPILKQAKAEYAKLQ